MPSRSLIDHDIVSAQWQRNLTIGNNNNNNNNRTTHHKSAQTTTNNKHDWRYRAPKQTDYHNRQHHYHHQHHHRGNHWEKMPMILDEMPAAGNAKLANMRRVSAVVLDSIRLTTVSTLQSLLANRHSCNGDVTTTTTASSIGAPKSATSITDNHCLWSKKLDQQQQSFGTQSITMSYKQSIEHMMASAAHNDTRHLHYRQNSAKTKPIENSKQQHRTTIATRDSTAQQIVDSVNLKIERLHLAKIHSPVASLAVVGSGGSAKAMANKRVANKASNQQKFPRFYWSYCLLAIVSICLLLPSTIVCSHAASHELIDVEDVLSVEPRQDAGSNVDQIGSASDTLTLARVNGNQDESSAPFAGDDGAEIDVMAGQTHIPTSQLFAAAGHVIPENFFAPGGTIPIHLAPTMANSQQASQQQQISQQQQQQQQQDTTGESSASIASYVDPNGYAMTTGSRDSNADLNDMLELFGGPASTFYSLASQSSQGIEQHQSLGAVDQSMGGANSDNMQVVYTHAGHIDGSDGPASANQGRLQDLMLGIGSNPIKSQVVGPAASGNKYHYTLVGQHQTTGGGITPYGLPTKGGSAPIHVLAPPRANTIVSPTLNALQGLPKSVDPLGQLASKLPSHTTPTVSVSSSKDPIQAVKVVNQKKRNVMRQAETLVKNVIDQVNKKFGTTIGDQTDIPFVLSSIGPIGMAQNLLTDPSFLITLLSSTEKNLFSNALPAPANAVIRPVLNFFRMPNKKRDKANLLNVISYLASGSGFPINHRSTSNGLTSKGTGIKTTSNVKRT